MLDARGASEGQRVHAGCGVQESGAQSSGKHEHGYCGIAMACGVLGLGEIKMDGCTPKKSSGPPQCELSRIRCWVTEEGKQRPPRSRGQRKLNQAERAARASAGDRRSLGCEVR